MNESEFENQLKRQPWRRVPGQWRDEILSAATPGAGDPAAARSSSMAPSAGRTQEAPWWRALLWPHPSAWAGLAALWLIAVGLQGSASRPQESSTPPRAAIDTSGPVLPEIAMAVAEQWKWRQELLRL